MSERSDVYRPWFEAGSESMTELEQIQRDADRLRRERAESAPGSAG